MKPSAWAKVEAALRLAEAVDNWHRFLESIPESPDPYLDGQRAEDALNAALAEYRAVLAKKEER